MKDDNKPKLPTEKVRDEIQTILDQIANGEEFENETLESYLEAMQAWLGSCENYYNRFGRDPSGFEVFADAISAASIYE